MFEIGGHKFYPQQFSVTVEDLDFDSGRNSDGTLTRTRVGIKRTLSVTMPPMRATDAATLLDAISPVKFAVTYYDPLRTLKGEDGHGTPNSSYTTGYFYAGNRTCVTYYDGAFDGATYTEPDKQYNDWSDTPSKKHAYDPPYGILYQSISFDLIEY